MTGADIVTIGETMILLYGEDTPAPIRLGERLCLDFGGADSNFAIAMSRLGYRSAWISRLGEEPLGELVLNGIAREGVDVSCVIRDPTRNTGLYLKHHDATGVKRIQYYRRGSAASNLQPDDLNPEAFRDARLVHLNGMTFALSESCVSTMRRALDLGVSRGAMISLDLNLRLQLWDIESARKALQPIIEKTSTIFGTEEEFLVYFGESDIDGALEAAVRLGPRIAVAKMGPDGAVALVDGLRLTHAGYRSPAVVDVVGAGDGFNAGFLASYLRGLSPYECLRRANLVGACAVAVAGDYQGYPTLYEMERLLESWQERRPAGD
ncbi:MAG TPA: sugar kinase [Candidatus Limnocylindria bacterium]|nr:sugar kinase [Candidatus Limnocylindria bacterium]